MDPALWQQRFAQDANNLVLAERTRERYHYEISVFVKFLQQQQLKNMAGLTREHLHAYWQHVYACRDRAGKPLKVGIMTLRLGCVKGFVRFLVRNDYLLLDVSGDLKLPKQGRRLPRTVLNESETLRVLESPSLLTAIGIRDRAILEVLYSTAIRNSELRQLQLDELDWARHLLFVAEGKGRKQRWVPMGEEAEVWLEEYLQRARPALARGNDQTVFLSKSGRPLQISYLARMVARRARAVGIEKHVTTHCLRHSCATHMLRRGASLKHIQTLLGHDSIQTTQLYTQVELKDLRQALRRYHPREKLR